VSEYLGIFLSHMKTTAIEDIGKSFSFFGEPTFQASA
jgi:hypothetical protein